MDAVRSYKQGFKEGLTWRTARAEGGSHGGYRGSRGGYRGGRHDYVGGYRGSRSVEQIQTQNHNPYGRVPHYVNMPQCVGVQVGQQQPPPQMWQLNVPPPPPIYVVAQHFSEAAPNLEPNYEQDAQGVPQQMWPQWPQRQ